MAFSQKEGTSSAATAFVAAVRAAFETHSVGPIRDFFAEKPWSVLKLGSGPETRTSREGPEVDTRRVASPVVTSATGAPISPDAFIQTENPARDRLYRAVNCTLALGGLVVASPIILTASVGIIAENLPEAVARSINTYKESGSFREATKVTLENLNPIHVRTVMGRVENPMAIIEKYSDGGFASNLQALLNSNDIPRFGALKLRTMYPESDSMLGGMDPLVVGKLPALQDPRVPKSLIFQVASPLLKAMGKEDCRVAKVLQGLSVSAWLRDKSSFDELLQLWNVVRGQMQLFGPRMAAPGELEMYEESAEKTGNFAPGCSIARHSVLPALFGVELAGREENKDPNKEYDIRLKGQLEHIRATDNPWNFTEVKVLVGFVLAKATSVANKLALAGATVFASLLGPRDPH